MKNTVLHYGKLPLNIRLVFLLIGFTGLSVFFLAIASLIYQLIFNVQSAISLWFAAVVTFGTMNALKTKTLKSYKKSIFLLISLPIYYAFVAITQTNVPDEAYKLIYSWPLFNSILYFCCIAVIANKGTYQFYSSED